MTLEAFIQKLEEMYHLELNENTKIYLPSINTFKTGIDSISKLYEIDPLARELIINGDIRGLEKYTNTIQSKYGNLLWLNDLFQSNNLTGIYQSIINIKNYHDKISYEKHLLKKGLNSRKSYDDNVMIKNYINEYIEEENLLKDFFQQVVNNDFSNLKKTTDIVNLVVQTNLILNYYLSIIDEDTKSNHKQQLKLT